VKKGFTLVELLVATSILVATFGGFMMTFNSLLKGAQQSKDFSLAFTASSSEIEKIENYNFDLLTRDYAAGGIPGSTYTLTTGGLNITGNITFVDQQALYGGGETQAVDPAAWSARVNHSSVTYNDKMWIMGGYDGSLKNDVWSSSDGITWTEETAAASWPARDNHSSVTYNDKMWIMGGEFFNDVWSSSDGITWTQETAAANWSARQRLTAVTYNDKMWIMGGYDGSSKRDVWSSSDGIAWTLETATAGWSARYNHTSIIYKNKMWVIGGNAGSIMNDVWSSSDGIAWTLETATPGWIARENHTSLVYDKKMWVIGGVGNKDVWYTTDGITWIKGTDSALWAISAPGRKSHSSLVYDNLMWVIGGDDGGIKNDVWWSAGYNRLLESEVTACFTQRDGRVIGATSGGNCDTSPATMKSFISENRPGIYLGR